LIRNHSENADLVLKKHSLLLSMQETIVLINSGNPNTHVLYTPHLPLMEQSMM